MSDMNQIKMKVMAGDVHAFYVTTEWKKKQKPKGKKSWSKSKRSLKNHE